METPAQRAVRFAAKKLARAFSRAPDRLGRAIRAQRKALLAGGRAGIVLFPPRKVRGGGLGYEDAARFGQRFKRLLEEAGIEARAHSFHRLRHTYCSELLARGVAPYLVSKWAGHGSTSFTEEHYAQWIPGDDHRELVNRLGEGSATVSAPMLPQSSKAKADGDS